MSSLSVPNLRYAFRTTLGLGLAMLPSLFLYAWMPASCLSAIVYLVIACMANKQQLQLGSVLHVTLASMYSIVLALVLGASSLLFTAVVAQLVSALDRAPHVQFESTIALVLLITSSVPIVIMRLHPELKAGGPIGLIVLGQFVLYPFTDSWSSLAKLFLSHETSEQCISIAAELFDNGTSTGGGVGGGSVAGFECTTSLQYSAMAWFVAVELLNALTYTATGAACALIIGFFVMPELATQQARMALADGLRDIADGLDRCTAELQRRVAGAAVSSSLHSESTPLLLIPPPESTIESRSGVVTPLLSFTAYEETVLFSDHVESSVELERVLASAEHLRRVVSRLSGAFGANADDGGFQSLAVYKWWGSSSALWTDLYHRLAGLVRRAAGDLRDRQSFASPGAAMTVADEIETIQVMRRQIRAQLLAAHRRNWSKLRSVADLTPMPELRTLMFVSIYSERMLDVAWQVLDDVRSVQEKRQAYSDTTTARPLWLKRCLSVVHTFTIEPFRFWIMYIRSWPAWLRQLKALRASTNFVYCFKHMVVLAASVAPFMLAAMFRSSSELVAQWLDRLDGYWIFVSAVIVFNRTLDSTFYKLVLRTASTIVAGVSGGWLMYYCYAASSPWIILVWTLAWGMVCLYYAQGVYSYLFLLSLVTQVMLVPCQFQHDLATCAPQVELAAWRLVSVLVGGTIATLVSGLLLPSVAVYELQRDLAEALERLGDLTADIVTAYCLVEQQETASATQRRSPLVSSTTASDSDLESQLAHDSFVSASAGFRQMLDQHEHMLMLPTTPNRASITTPTRRQSVREKTTDIASEPEHLRMASLVEEQLEGIDKLLKSCQTTMSVDTAGWSMGPFSVPAHYRQLLTDLQLLVSDLRLAHVLSQRDPVLTGQYHGTTYGFFIVPLRTHFDSIAHAVQELAQLIASRLKDPHHDSSETLRQTTDKLARLRQQFTQIQQQARGTLQHDYHATKYSRSHNLLRSRF